MAEERDSLDNVKLINSYSMVIVLSIGNCPFEWSYRVKTNKEYWF